MNSIEAKAKSEVDELVEAVNALSDDATYLASCDWFGSKVMGKAILAAAQNSRQENAFQELMKAGFVYLDTERGVVGYRSTYGGQRASGIARAALSGASQ